MGWEAIEQYLIEAEKEVQYLDQQVPQMLVDGHEVMQQTTDFYTEELMYNKPIPVCDTVEQTINREETSDLYDLDQEENTFYPNNYTNCVSKPTSAPLIDIDSYCCNSSVYIKPEPLSEYPDCVVRHCGSTSNYICSENVEEQQYMTMKSKILDVCIKDVEETCKYLKVSPDPHQWTPDNVQQWIGWQCGECGAQQPNLDNFYMSGLALCSMTEEKFKILAPEAGSDLFYRLVYWRNVVEQKMSRSYQTLTPPPIAYIPVPMSPSLPSSPDSVSSNPAILSDTESQPSSPHCTLPTSDDTDRLPEEPVNHHRQTIQLWQFLKLLLLDGHFTDCIRWVDRSRGIFKIENSSRVAKLWGKRKNRPLMNYDKLSRSIRQYYKKNIIKKTEHSKRLVYQFCRM